MNTQHALAILLSETTSDESCRQQVIDHMLSIFPDAVVDGAPVIMEGTNSKTVRVKFTSPMFDHVADQMLGIINDEFSSLKNWLNDSSELTQENKLAYSYIIDALTNRVNAIFGERE